MLFFRSVKMKSSPIQFFHELRIKCLVQFFTEVSLPASDFTLTKKTWFWRINWHWKRVRIFLHFGKCALMGDFSDHFFWQRFLKKFTDSANITTQVLKERKKIITRWCARQPEVITFRETSSEIIVHNKFHYYISDRSLSEYIGRSSEKRRSTGLERAGKIVTMPHANK